MRSKSLLLAALFVVMAYSADPVKMPPGQTLWEHAAPGALGDAEADQPMLFPYLAQEARNTGTAVIVFPGGGYRNLAMDHEGDQVAKWLNSFGVTAFVLRYRLGPKYHHPIEMQDAQRAIRYVRSNAAKLHFAPERIGVWGFSAGGHLASTVSTHFDNGDPGASDPIDRVGCRPDFAILAYPVISFTTPYTHKGSLQNLLGESPDPKLVQNLSNELQVSAQTPPTFLFHTNGDTGVPAENSVLYYLALRKAGVPAEIHVYEKGPHGVGLGVLDLALSSWPRRLEEWMQGRGLLKR